MNSPEWWSGSPPITDPHVLENAEASISRGIKLGRGMRLGVAATILMAAPAIGYGIKSYAEDNSDIAAEFSRDILGDTRTQWLEGKYLAFEDWKTRKMYDLGFGPDEKPFNTPNQIVINPEPEAIPTPYAPSVTTTPTPLGEIPIEIPPVVISTEIPKPKPFLLPETHVIFSNPLPGEGEWSIDGLPTTSEELIMAKTFIRPDINRPYANVAAIVLDSRRVKLNMVGGAISRGNGGDKGPGRVPAQDLSNLLLVMNGGFQFDHARQNFNTSLPFVWGAYLDGVEYATLQPGMASVAVFKDGTIKVGTWGEGELSERTEDMIAVRQNGPLMIKDGELTSAIKNEGDVFMWGKLAPNSAGTVITARSAIGMTKEGNLIIAAANDMSALSLAKGLQAAGAYTAMQLDINYPWVQIGVVSDHAANGTPILKKFMDSMQQNGNKFIGSPQERDLMYITRDDDSRYK